MKPIRLTELARPKNENRVIERLMLIDPDSIAHVCEDKIRPFGEQKHDGPIPIIDKNFSNQEIDCRRLTTKTRDVFAVKESFLEVEKRWTEGLTGAVQLPPVPADTEDPEQRLHRQTFGS